MHRRGIALLLGFLVAVTVAGGGAVRAPFLPATESTSREVTRSAVVGHLGAGRIRME